MINIALAQISNHLGDVSRNLAKHLEYIDQAKNERADLVIFPELSLTGYAPARPCSYRRAFPFQRRSSIPPAARGEQGSGYRCRFCR